MIRVAFFEDNTLVRDFFEAILKTEGFLCTGSFSSCNNLAQDLKKSDPDVVLMDIGMTGMDGIEATRKTRELYPAKKILIQTVFEDDEKIFSAICAGASGYILKKTSPAKLLEAIQEVHAGGAPMSPGIATKVLHLFQRFAPSTSITTDEANSLTKRENEILLLMMEGDNFPAIAEKLFLSYETVRTHVRSIYKKLHVTSVTGAIVKGFKKGTI